jgi:AraC-like DNA-binding protein
MHNRVDSGKCGPFIRSRGIQKGFFCPAMSGASKQVCLNEFKLKKYFRQMFGLSVFALVQQERLKRAKQLIFEGEKNISAIAYELGYAHPQHFQRAFKQQFGVTPGSLLK